MWILGCQGSSNSKTLEQQRWFAELTPREREVLELIAHGLSNDEIAERLVIAPKTVRNHVSRIYSKLRTGRRAQAVVLARPAGLGHRESGS